jgi:hypothetical protein
MKNAFFWDVMPMALVRIDITEENVSSIIRGTTIGDL